MEGKSCKDSNIIMTQQMNPHDANLAGNVHGGIIMKFIDSAALAVAVRHARVNTVTASIDRLDFHYPIFVGDLLTARASLNFVGRTSMEIGVRVETENLMTEQIHHTSSAYLTFVALDKSGRPMMLPPLVLDTDEDQRQNLEAKTRREMRLKEKRRKRQTMLIQIALLTPKFLHSS
ncbi:MAG: acyl-CoA thioesterase [Smithellaceae bacterium]|jgi:uncharacterized protein (TIGR00369 family)|nr:acyl-CoA thioesterase [Smithellaceae bacterium]